MSVAFPTTDSPRPVRVLVVDDSSVVVEGIRRFLLTRPRVAVVSTALGGREAIERCRQDAPDLVLMDIHMPDPDGLKTAARIRREFPNVRIILTSVDQGDDLRLACSKHGADVFLPKIGLQRNLMTEVRRLLPDHFG